MTAIRKPGKMMRMDEALEGDSWVRVDPETEVFTLRVIVEVTQAAGGSQVTLRTGPSSFHQGPAFALVRIVKAPVKKGKEPAPATETVPPAVEALEPAKAEAAPTVTSGALREARKATRRKKGTPAPVSTDPFTIADRAQAVESPIETDTGEW